MLPVEMTKDLETKLIAVGIPKEYHSLLLYSEDTLTVLRTLTKPLQETNEVLEEVETYARSLGDLSDIVTVPKRMQCNVESALLLDSLSKNKKAKKQGNDEGIKRNSTEPFKMLPFAINLFIASTTALPELNCELIEYRNHLIEEAERLNYVDNIVVDYLNKNHPIPNNLHGLPNRVYTNCLSRHHNELLANSELYACKDYLSSNPNIYEQESGSFFQYVKLAKPPTDRSERLKIAMNCCIERGIPFATVVQLFTGKNWYAFESIRNLIVCTKLLIEDDITEDEITDMYYTLLTSGADRALVEFVSSAEYTCHVSHIIANKELSEMCYSLIPLNVLSREMMHLAVLVYLYGHKNVLKLYNELQSEEG